MAAFWSLLFGCLLSTALLVPSVLTKHLKQGTEYSGQEAEADRVTNLPGQPPVKFRHYAGYVKLRPHDEKALFYWFFEAQQNPSQKPLLWLNGGPGCSSIGFGAAQELGPFLVRSNGNLTLNEFSWNKVENVLFVESPVGVGFSYTNNSRDLLNLGDRITALDSYDFLIEWFKRFPSFKSHDFYVAGESYAGHYVPQLAELIYDRNKDPKNESYINLKGFMIGNAVINDETDTKGMIDYAWTHAIISDQLYYGIIKECDFRKENQTGDCRFKVRGLLEAYSDIDIYSIYSPICLSSYQPSLSSKLLGAPPFLTPHELWHKLPSGYETMLVNISIGRMFRRPCMPISLTYPIHTLFAVLLLRNGMTHQTQLYQSFRSS